MSEVSVIIPSYQHAKTLTPCLEAVFSQTLAPKEVIVVNDGSTDNTEEVLQPYMDRITYIHQENAGGNAARNRGFDASTGAFVVFLDADAVMEPNMLETLYEALQSHPEAAYAYSGFRFGWKAFPSHAFSASALRNMNYIHTSALIRREAFPRFDESIRRFQDWDVWLTMLGNGHKGVHVNKELFRALEATGRKGISSWRPRIFYRIPWHWFGWKPASLRAYEEAKAVIQQKHGL